MDPIKLFYQKRGQQLVKNLMSRHFDAYYFGSREEALRKALELIPSDASVGWGGAMTAEQIGLIDALRSGDYRVIDRDNCSDRDRAMHDCLSADVFITGANAISIDGQMVNIDGNGNRVAGIIYGPKQVIVFAGMNKVVDNLEAAYIRARTVAAPRNQQRFEKQVPCTVNGVCSDCKCEDSICNQIVITRNCRPAGRIKFILVGEDLGL